MSAVWVPSRPVTAAEWSARAGAPTEVPCTGGIVRLSAGRVSLSTFESEGVQLIVGDGDALDGAFGAVPLRDALGAADPIRAIGLAAAGARVGDDAGRDVLVAALVHDDPLLRRLAARFAWVLGAEALPAVLAAAERFPDVRSGAEQLALQVAEAAAGTLGDLPTTDSLVLGRRAHEAALAGQTVRARRAAEALLEQSPADTRGIFALGVALADEDPILAAFLLGAVSTARGYEDDAPLEFPDAAERCAAALRGAGEASEGTVDRMVSFVTAWERGSPELSYRGAAAVIGRVPALEPLLRFLIAAWTNDLHGLEAATRAAPGVPTFRDRWLLVLDESEPERADRERGEWLARFAPPTGADARLDEAVRGFGAPLGPSVVLRRRAERAYAREDRDAALAFAEQALALDPDDVDAHQVRALALTFSHRYPEAIDAYAATVAAMDRAYDDPDSVVLSDPRPQMWLNRACCEVRADRRADALDSLRRAVRGDEDKAESAAEDDWLAPLWDDPEFRAIVAREPEALVLAAHRTAAHAVGVLARALDAENGGDLAEAAALALEAATAAAAAGEPAVRAEALARRGRALAFLGRIDEGLQCLADATAFDPSVPARVRGDVYAQLGVVHQLRGAPSAARDAYLQATAEREATGDPLLVARSQLTLSALELELGQVDAASARVEAALPVLRAAVEAGAPPNVHDDLASAWIRSAAIALARRRPDDATSALERAVEGLERLAAAGAPPLGSLVDAVIALCDAAPQVRARAEALRSGGAAEGRVHALFRTVSTAVAGWRVAGVDDARIAGWLCDALAGRGLPPEAEGVLGPVRTLFGELAAREPTVLVSGPLGAELARDDLDGALVQLRDLFAAVG